MPNASKYEWPLTIEYQGQKYRINHLTDQQLLAGSSRNGKTIYFDRHWNPEKLVDGKMMDRLYPVCVHEIEEKRAEDQGKPYLTAHHEFAEPAEKKVVQEMGYDWMAYQDSFKKEIQRCSHESKEHLPKDEEMKPYGRKRH